MVDMGSLDFIARLIFFCGWLVIIFKCIPDFFKDVRKEWEEYRKSSAECKSAKQVKKSISKYNISEFRNINNLDRRS